MELHIPTSNAVAAVASVAGAVTDGLDAVVVAHEISTVHEGCVHLTLAGNPRDLALAAERAAKLGGVVD